MTFPTRMTAREAWDRAQTLAKILRSDAIAVRGASAAGTMTSGQALDLAIRLYGYKTEFNTLKNVAGVQAYAQSILNDNTINVATEYTNMIAAMDNVTSWLVTNFPKTATTNELRAVTWNADNSGRTVDVVFSASATATFRTALDGLTATIE